MAPAKLSLRLVAILGALVLVAAIVAVVRLAIGTGPDERRLGADFANTVSLYEGAKVQILGVDVGAVDSVRVTGTKVHVELHYDAKYRLPADVRAVIAAPAVVGDRVVQLTPAYQSGKTLADGASLSISQTAVPLELDDTFRETDRLAAALGPNGANSNGALSQLLVTLQQNLKGNGAQVNSTIRKLAGALGTLSGVRGDVAGTITSLSKVTSTLAARDPEVRQLMGNLAAVSEQLSDQRGDLATATRSLDSALKRVTSFIAKNRGKLSSNITQLTKVTRTLAAHKSGLEEIVDLAPLAVTNLLEAGLPENFDLKDPDAVNPAARLAAVPVRADLFSGLSRQLGGLASDVCAKLTAPSQGKLAGLCTALQQAGGNLGDVLGKLLMNGGLLSGNPSTSMSQLLRGGA